MSALSHLVRLIYPSRCPFCGTVLEPWEEGMCSACASALPWVQQSDKQVDFCNRCLSPLWYREGVARGIKQMKFHGGANHTPLFGSLMAQHLESSDAQPLDGVTWVPLSRQGLARRGYDQAMLLAQEVASHLSLPLVDALVKVRHTKTQSRLTHPAARRANVSGAYALKQGVDVTGRSLLLVDDVVTSGATLSECSATLKLWGATQVVALTAARAQE